jgi:muramoyltetrapeptide carboxypeptidase
MQRGNAHAIHGAACAIDRTSVPLYVASPSTRRAHILPANHSAPRIPPPLAPGARVALVAPSGPLRDDGELERAIGNARSLGWEPAPGRHVLVRQRYLAGSDEQRLSDLNSAIRDARIDGIWCVRGGYGAMRIVDGVDLEALARTPKAVLGYSDVTSLHLAIRARCALVSYHAPTARSELTPFTRRSLERAVRDGGDPCGDAPRARILRGGTARGALVGGNLALLAAHIGTPYALDTTNTILVLEDVKESVYRIDRMLRQLRLSGCFDKCSGVVLGQFTERGDGEDDDDAALEALLQEVAEWIDGPVLAGAPVGHIADQWTLPLNAMAELDADARRLTTVLQTMA